MNVSGGLDPPTIGFPKPLTPSSGCDLDCKERLFRTLADRGRLRVLDTLCKGAKTVEQIVFRGPLDRCISKSLAEGTSASPYVPHLHRACVFLEVAKALGLILLIKFQLLNFLPQ